jgi:hypothetical protein
VGADQERKASAAEKGTTMKELLTIEPVTIYKALQGRYIRFVSDLDICNDGSGPDYDDPSYQSQTAYYNDGEFLNADEDKYIVFQAVMK